MLSSNTSAVSGDTVYVEDVFSTYLYTGTGSAQTITNGVDLSTKGGLVWIKRRDLSDEHALIDTQRGTNSWLGSERTSAPYAYSGFTSFNSTGFTLGAPVESSTINGSGRSLASWTFRKQPKFFTQGTFTGNGANRTISHDLGSAPGMIIVKRTDTTAPWIVYHRSLGATKYIFLNATSAASTGSTYWNNTDPTSTVFSLGTEPDVNGSGGTFVYYAFAHDAGGFGLTGTDNVISCGTFTSDGAGGATISLGYEPQFFLYKRTNSAANWNILDNMRGFSETSDAFLYPNLSDAENVVSGTYVRPSATGVIGAAGSFGFSNTYIYIAIRRGPMKVPTDGTKVFKPVTYTGSGAAQTVTAGFPVDLSINGNRGTATIGQFFFDRLRGATKALNSTDTTAEATDSTSLTSFASNTAITLGTSASGWVNDSGRTYIDWLFQRAPSFFDEVCYTGAGSSQTQSHNLGVAPELMIVKCRNRAGSTWPVYSSAIGATKALSLESTSGQNTNGVLWNNTAPTSTVFTIGASGGDTNSTGDRFVAYLFATCPGVSKVGSYTGNGSSQTINCGFAAGARFVLIKRTDSTGDWYVWDTARGIVAGNDGHLSLNTTAAEVTTNDTIDTDSSGFIVNQLAATNVNVNAATYIFLAIA